MKLKKLKEVVDAMVDYAGDCDPDVEIAFKKTTYDIGEIRQFNIIPNVTIEIGKKIWTQD